MLENGQTTGSIQSSRQDKQRLALQSLEFNVKNVMCVLDLSFDNLV